LTPAPAPGRRRREPLVAFDARRAYVSMPHGSGVYVRRLLEALRARGGGIELLELREGGRGPELWWEQVRLPALLRRRGAALVHSPDTFLPLRRNCPGVVTIHDLGFATIRAEIRGVTGWKYRALVPRVARSAERVICPSRFTAADLVQRFAVPEARIRVIPEAPALAQPADGGDPPPPGPYLLAAGDLRPKKNLPLLVQAYRRLRGVGLAHRLVLAGADFGVAGELRSLAGNAPLELCGFVSDRRLDALLRGADALVLPSVYEGFGLVALDAMVRACPVILARAGALPEVAGEAAAYFDPEDVEALAAAIAAVVTDRAEHRRLSAAGRERAAQFSWEQTAQRTLEVYRELL
jgi:glycosyltransferase involved in cell wall biosynthesis